MRLGWDSKPVRDADHAGRVLMAHAQRLQEEVKGLNARCQELEKELARAKGEDEDLHHLLGPRTDRDLSAPLDTVSEGFGSLSIGVDGQAMYHGETSSSEVSTIPFAPDY